MSRRGCRRPASAARRARRPRPAARRRAGRRRGWARRAPSRRGDRRCRRGWRRTGWPTERCFSAAGSGRRRTHATAGLGGAAAAAFRPAVPAVEGALGGVVHRHRAAVARDLGVAGVRLQLEPEAAVAEIQTRPPAPLRERAAGERAAGKRWLVKVMRALKPATGFECRAAFRAEASERGGGLGPERLGASAMAVTSTARRAGWERRSAWGSRCGEAGSSGAFLGGLPAVWFAESETESGKRDRKAGAVDRELAAVSLGGGPDERQAEAGALRAGAVRAAPEAAAGVGTSSAGMPAPASATVITTWPSAPAARTVIGGVP